MDRAVTVQQLNDWLRGYRTHPRTITGFVMGHAAPDTDTVVSSLAEAYRRARRGEPGIAPLVQGQRLPREVAWLLGDTGALMPLSCDPDFFRRMADPSVTFILTDHQEEEALAGRVAGVIDHHPRLPGVPLPAADVDIRTVGAATSLIALRWQQDGLRPDRAVARLLLGAILADTEGLLPAKVKDEDARAARWLISLSEEDPAALFDALRTQLLAETDLTALYQRDYRAFQGLGFAILKIQAETPVEVPRLKAMLEEDRQQQGLRLCLAKVARYGQDGLREETYYMAAATPALAAAAVQVLHTASGGTVTAAADGGWHIPPEGKHLSRKRLVPLLLPLTAPKK